MNQEPANHQAGLSTAILKTVLYADLFDYPVTTDEICRYLPEVEAPRDEVLAVLHSSAANGLLQRRNGFFTLPDRDHLGDLRERRATIAARKWRRAWRYGAIIAHLPYVRMVAVTGTLAVDNVEPQDDLDFLVITAPGRLWLCRALVIFVVYLARLSGDSLCPNYFLTERGLELLDCDFFAARELAQMVPLYGSEVYSRMRSLNDWTHTFLPQADGPPSDVSRDLSRVGRAWQAGLERALNGRIGSALEAWEMRRKIQKLSQQMHSASDRLAFSADCCKGHFDGHGRVILDLFEQRVRELGL